MKNQIFGNLQQNVAAAAEGLIWLFSIDRYLHGIVKYDYKLIKNVIYQLDKKIIYKLKFYQHVPLLRFKLS